MDETLKRACAHLGIEPEKVMTWRVYDDHIAMVVQPGPKYKVPLDDLKVIKLKRVKELPASEPCIDHATVRYEAPPTELPASEESLLEPKPTSRAWKTWTSAAIVLAQHNDIDILTVQGTGAGGKILKRDVQRLIGGK